MTTEELWRFLPLGYLFSILIETPILLVGLSKPHPWTRRLFAGFWLTGCTYPIIILVIPAFFDPTEQRGLYLAVAETFAPVAECLLFRLAFGTSNLTTGQSIRDMIAIVVANLASFGVGELLIRLGVFASAVT